MNDPTPAERDALGARLTRAIPAEPELTGLAERAESGARRTRQTRHAGVAVGAMVVVAAVIVVPQLVSSQPVHSGQEPGSPQPVQLPDSPCRGEPDHPDFTRGTAAWVTFCPTKPVGRDFVASRVPTQVLTTDAASLVAAWQRATGFVHGCPFSFGATEFTVRVGFTDGTSTTVSGDTGGCQTGLTPSDSTVAGPGGFGVYDDLVRALGRQAASGHPRDNPPGPPRECPASRASPGRFNIDGESAPQLAGSDMLLDMTAVEGLVCRYDGSGALTGSGPAAEPEDLRIASGSSVMAHPFQRWRHALDVSYLVMLRDRTDTWRTFTITGRKGTVTFFRGHSPGVAQRIGYAGESLVLLAHDATR